MNSMSQPNLTACRKHSSSDYQQRKGPATEALERSLKRRRLSNDDKSTATTSTPSFASAAATLASMDDLFRSIIDFPVIEWDSDEVEGPTVEDETPKEAFFCVVG